MLIVIKIFRLKNLTASLKSEAKTVKEYLSRVAETGIVNRLFILHLHESMMLLAVP